MKNEKGIKGVSRRELLASTAALAAAAAGLTAAPALSAGKSKVAGANDALQVGVIGTGKMGRSNMLAFSKGRDVRVAAVCDCYRPNLDLALKTLADENLPKPQEFADFRKLLDLKEIDVVIVASPDHWHPLHAVMAARAGKDVYVEKPVSVTVSEGRKMTEVSRETGKIIGVGTQQRSGKHFQRAVEIVQSGKLGRITRVSAWNYENEYPEGIGNPPDASPHPGLDWDMWLGPAPMRPFNINRFGVVDDGRWSSFRWFWDYAGGMATDWGTHLIDIVLWAMKVKGPDRVTSLGGKLALLDNRDTPDTLMSTFEFPGFVLTYESRKCCSQTTDGRSYGIVFHGSDAALFVDRGGFALEPETIERGSESEARMVPVKGDGSEQHQTHVETYIDCVRNRKRFISDIEDGHYASSTPHLANLSLRLGRSLRWDPNAERFIGDSEADAMLSRPYRAPWSLG